MSIESVRRFFAVHGMENRVIEYAVSSATVELAAQATGVVPGRIAKTLSFSDRAGGCILVVAAGDARISNGKFKSTFGIKATMLSADDVFRLVGHAVGGVCPFAINQGVPVYLDVSLQAYETVFPACGSANSTIELTCDELFKVSGAQGWVDVCQQQQD